ASDPACNMLHDPLAGISLPYPEADFAISMAINPTPYVITSAPLTISGLQYALFAWGNAALASPWMRITFTGVILPGSDGLLHTRPAVGVGLDDLIRGGEITW